jgi:hypothetical protein
MRHQHRSVMTAESNREPISPDDVEKDRTSFWYGVPDALFHVASDWSTARALPSHSTSTTLPRCALARCRNLRRSIPAIAERDDGESPLRLRRQRGPAPARPGLAVSAAAGRPILRDSAPPRIAVRAVVPVPSRHAPRQPNAVEPSLIRPSVLVKRPSFSSKGDAADGRCADSLCRCGPRGRRSRE